MLESPSLVAVLAALMLMLLAMVWFYGWLVHKTEPCERWWIPVFASLMAVLSAVCIIGPSTGFVLGYVPDQVCFVVLIASAMALPTSVWLVAGGPSLTELTRPRITDAGLRAHVQQINDAELRAQVQQINADAQGSVAAMQARVQHVAVETQEQLNDVLRTSGARPLPAPAPATRRARAKRTKKASPSPKKLKHQRQIIDLPEAPPEPVNE